jgi:alpha-beta hydrolase superfamily lysophospholipase
MPVRRAYTLTLVVVCVVGAVLLGGCAPKYALPGPAVTTPDFASEGFTTADGVTLPVRQWLPVDPQKPRGVLIALHGFNDYSKAFDAVPGSPGLGPYLAARGYAVFAYDQRGFGRAPNHGLWPGRDALTADLSAFTRVLHGRYPGVPFYGLGESMGGAVMLAALAGPDPPALDGAVLVAPAVWARATMPLLYRIGLWTAVRLAPGWRPTGKGLGRMASDNIAMLRGLNADPLFIKKTRIDAVEGLAELMDSGLAATAKLKSSVLYLYGGRDEIIPPKASALAMERLLSNDPLARGAFYDRSWHMMMRDLEGETVLGDIAAFLAHPTAPLPSGADVAALERLKARAKKPWVLKAPPKSAPKTPAAPLPAHETAPASVPDSASKQP